MRAILLSAGLGTRLRPITDDVPKCLVPINGKPLLQIWLERLTAAGVGPFLINTHYLSDQVEKFIKQSVFSDQVELAYEYELHGTAGTLIKNLDFFQGEDGMLIHADNYCLADFGSFVLSHVQRPLDCVMTMMTFHTDTPSTCGIVELDSNQVVVSFHEKVNSPPSDLANGAIYILSEEFMNLVNRDFSHCYDFSTEILPFFMGRIFTYEYNGMFLDIGTPERYKQANL